MKANGSRSFLAASRARPIHAASAFRPTLAVILFVSGTFLGGCTNRGGSNLAPPARRSSPKTTARNASKGPTFAFCPKALNNPYFDLVRQGANERADELGLPRPDWVGSTSADAGRQVAMINDLISRGVDGIAVSPNAPDSVNGVIERAMSRGIPVLCFDADAPKSKRAAYVGTDNFAAGRKAGEEMKRLLPDGGEVLVITGGLGALNLNERIRGFRSGIEGSRVRVASVQPCDDDPAKAHRIVQDYLLSHPDTTGIFAAGLWAVLPAGRILAAKHLTGKIKVVGFDTLPEELAMVKDGSIQALVGQRPREMGRLGIEILNDLHKGKQPEKAVIDTGVDVVTRANVDRFLPAEDHPKPETAGRKPG